MKLPDDPFVRELLPEFVEDWIIQIDNDYPKLFEEKNKEDLYRMAHTMKGSCYQFGINELGDLGVELMNDIKDENWDVVNQKFKKVRTILTDIDNQLKD